MLVLVFLACPSDMISSGLVSSELISPIVSSILIPIFASSIAVLVATSPIVIVIMRRKTSVFPVVLLVVGPTVTGMVAACVGITSVVVISESHLLLLVSPKVSLSARSVEIDLLSLVGSVFACTRIVADRDTSIPIVAVMSTGRVVLALERRRRVIVFIVVTTLSRGGSLSVSARRLVLMMVALIRHLNFLNIKLIPSETF